MRTLSALELLVAAAAAAAPMAPAARAVEVYENQRYHIRVRAPGDGFEMRRYETPSQGEWFGWADCLLEMRNAETRVSALLLYSEAAFKAERLADERELLWKKNNRSVIRTAEKKLAERKPGTWLLREFLIEAEANDFRYLHLFIAKGKHDYELVIWCPDAVFEDERETMYRSVDLVEYGEGEAAGAIPSNPVAKVAENPWKGANPGTTVTYRTVSEVQGMKTEILAVHELVTSGEKAFTVRVVTKTPGGPAQETLQAFEVDASAARPPAARDAPAERAGAEARVETGKEKVATPAGEFDCEWVKTTTAEGWSKAWTSPAVPTRLVKTESEMAGARSVMELVEVVRK